MKVRIKLSETSEANRLLGKFYTKAGFNFFGEMDAQSPLEKGLGNRTYVSIQPLQSILFSSYNIVSKYMDIVFIYIR